MAEMNPPEDMRRYSSVWANQYLGVGHARSTLNSPQAWSAGKNEAGEYVEMDLGNTSLVRGIILQGRGGSHYGQFVKTYKVAYSMDERHWHPVSGEFFGGVGGSNKTDMLPTAVEARYVRIIVLSWQHHISLRAGVIACPACSHEFRASSENCACGDSAFCKAEETCIFDAASGSGSCERGDACIPGYKKATEGCACGSSRVTICGAEDTCVVDRHGSGTCHAEEECAANGNAERGSCACGDCSVEICRSGALCEVADGRGTCHDACPSFSRPAAAKCACGKESTILCEDQQSCVIDGTSLGCIDPCPSGQEKASARCACGTSGVAVCSAGDTCVVDCDRNGFCASGTVTGPRHRNTNTTTEARFWSSSARLRQVISTAQ